MKKIIALMLLFFYESCLAAQVYPKTWEFRVIGGDPPTYSLNYSWGTNYSINNNSTVNYYGTSYSYGLRMRYTLPGSPNIWLLQGQNTIRYVPVVYGDTWNSLNDKFISTYGANGSVSVINSASGKIPDKFGICIGIWNNSNSTLQDSPPGVDACPEPTTTPPVVTSCDASASASINHGGLSPEQVSGNVASTSIVVTCTRPATALITSSVSSLYLGNNIYSTISIDGKQAGNSISLPQGASNHIISSRLSTTAALAGSFGGSLVLTLNIQ
ncbi:MrpH family fimbial adhesin [Serratia aquatilis]|uniref:Fimbrial adhesin MrpH C-terminal domain-containing protein n=1 Tax=Serratia aquatilis TaxID=1737515 RepID=A0ABV6EJF8_9GAMM